MHIVTSHPLGHHVSSSSTPNLGATSMYQPPSSYPVYTRPDQHDPLLSITTRNLPSVDWRPTQSDCEPAVDGYPLQQSVPITSSQPYSAIYGLEKEQIGAPMPYLNSPMASRPTVTTESTLTFDVIALQSSIPRTWAFHRQLPRPTAMRQMVPTIGSSTATTSQQSYTEMSRSPESSPVTLTPLPSSAAYASTTTPSMVNPVSTLSPISKYYSLDEPNSLSEMSSNSDISSIVKDMSQ